MSRWDKAGVYSRNIRVLDDEMHSLWVAANNHLIAARSELATLHEERDNGRMGVGHSRAANHELPTEIKGSFRTRWHGNAVDTGGSDSQIDKGYSPRAVVNQSSVLRRNRSATQANFTMGRRSN